MDNKIVLVAIIFTIISSITLVQIEFASAEKKYPSEFAPDILLVKFKKDIPQSQQNLIFSQNDSVVIDEISQIDLKIIQVSSNALEKVETALLNNPNIEYVERDYLLEPTITPNDQYFDDQWHLTTIQAEQAWDISKGDLSPIAILDSGYDLDHPDLAGKLLIGFNPNQDNTDVSNLDGCNHGTYVAGTAAAITGNDEEGVAGVAWENPIIPIKITRYETSGNCNGYYSDMIKGITYAADNDSRVANISYRIFNGLGLGSAAQYMHDTAQGWVVASAGNTGKFENYPDNPYIISVSATGPSDVKTGFSSYGPYVDFAAPGSGILTTKNGGGYTYVSGTSFSAPITSGVIALLFSYNPSLTADQVLEILKTSSVDLGDDGYDHLYGWGRIDAYQALLLANSPDDNINPSVSVTNPEDGSNVSGIITVSVTSSDNVGISKVELYVDNQLYDQSFNSSPDFILDTNYFENGNRQVTAKAYDFSNNQNSSSIMINVNNVLVPTLEITSPVNGANLGGNTNIIVAVSGFTQDPTVNISINGTDYTLYNPPYEYQWRTKDVPVGTYLIEAEVDGGPYDSMIVYKAQKGKGGDGGGNGGGEKPCKGNSKKPNCINQ